MDLFITSLNWITSQRVSAIASVVMVIIAGKALHTWKEQLKYDKKIEVIKNLYRSIENIIQFLEEIDSKSNNNDNLFNKLEFFKSEIALINTELKIINNKKFNEFINYMKQNLKPFFMKHVNSAEDTKSILVFHFGQIEKEHRDEMIRKSKEAKLLCESELYKLYK